MIYLNKIRLQHICNFGIHIVLTSYIVRDIILLPIKWVNKIHDSIIFYSDYFIIGKFVRSAASRP